MKNDEVTFTIQIDSDLSDKEKQEIYMDIINELNDRFINVLEITNNKQIVFDYKKGFKK